MHAYPLFSSFRVSLETPVLQVMFTCTYRSCQIFLQWSHIPVSFHLSHISFPLYTFRESSSLCFIFKPLTSCRSEKQRDTNFVVFLHSFIRQQCYIKVRHLWRRHRKFQPLEPKIGNGMLFLSIK